MTLTNQEYLRRKNLGIFLRAARNNFHYSERHNSYIRIRPLDERREFFEVESCSASEIVEKTPPSAHAKGLLYLAFGDSKDAKESIFQSLPFSRRDTESYRTWTLQLVGDKLQVVEPLKG